MAVQHRGQRRSGTVALAVVAGLLALANPAEAATTIGDTTANNNILCNQPGVNLLNTATAGPPTYAVPAGGGIITAWSWRTGADSPGSGKLLVLKPTAPPSYTVVAKSAQQTFSGVNQVNTFPTRIPVSAGDLIGFRTGGAMRCGFTSAAGDMFGIGAANSPEPEPGSAVQFPSVVNGFRVPVSAVVEPDVDGDGLGDESQDNCPGSANSDQRDEDGDGQANACDGDDDGDGLLDGADNCSLDSNPDQADRDGDGLGNACDSDSDNDGVLDGDDNCPRVANPTQVDSSGNAAGDACDTPDTVILKAKKTVKTAKKKGKLRATFDADQNGATFTCALDRAAAKPCTSPFSIKAKLGKHTLTITAIGEAGLADPFPAVHSFRVVPKPAR